MFEAGGARSAGFFSRMILTALPETGGEEQSATCVDTHAAIADHAPD
jgi:hypothetical protein